MTCKLASSCTCLQVFSMVRPIRRRRKSPCAQAAFGRSTGAHAQRRKPRERMTRGRRKGATRAHPTQSQARGRWRRVWTECGVNRAKTRGTVPYMAALAPGGPKNEYSCLLRCCRLLVVGIFNPRPRGACGRCPLPLPSLSLFLLPQYSQPFSFLSLKTRVVVHSPTARACAHEH